MHLIQPLARGVPLGLVSLALGLSAAAVSTAASAAGARAPARATTVRLDWTEYAPLCNTVSSIGVPGCGADPYPAVFRLRVTTLSVIGNTWSLGLSLTNLIKTPLSFRGPLELCLLYKLSTTRTDCMPASTTSRPLVTLAPGATWQALEEGRGKVPNGRWIRVLLPGTMGSFTSRTGGVISWLSVHAYHFTPGGSSVARYNGDGG